MIHRGLKLRAPGPEPQQPLHCHGLRDGPVNQPGWVPPSQHGLTLGPSGAVGTVFVNLFWHCLGLGLLAGSFEGTTRALGGRGQRVSLQKDAEVLDVNMRFSCATRLLCPWDSPGKNTGVGRHALLQGIFLTQEDGTWVQCISCIGSQFIYH